MKRIAVLHWATSSVGGINTCHRVYRTVAERRGDTYHVLASNPQKTKRPGLFPERRRVRGGDTFITIDGEAPYHPDNLAATVQWLASNYDIVMTSFLCPHPTKSYGNEPLFIPLFEQLAMLGIPIIGYIRDAYWDSYREWGERVLPYCVKTMVSQIAYGRPLVAAGYPVQPAYIPFEPLCEEPDVPRDYRSVCWTSQWKNVKGVNEFVDGLPALADAGYTVRLYSNGIRYYQMRTEPEWVLGVGADHFAPEFSGIGSAEFFGYVDTHDVPRVLASHGFMCDFQGGKAKHAAYRQGSYNNTIVEALYYGCVPVVHANLAQHGPIPAELLLPVADLARYPELIQRYDARAYPRERAREYVRDEHSGDVLYDRIFATL